MSEEERVVIEFDEAARRLGVSERRPPIAADSTAPSLQFGGENDGGDMDVSDYVDAKIETVRVANDARFDEVISRLDHVPTTASMLATAAGAIVTIAGILLALLAFGGDRFDAGVQLTSVSVEQALEAQRLAKENTERLEGLDDKLDTVLRMLGERVKE
ncbi:MAG: hypothetical protein ACE5JZ_01730 [Kiloniellales bacterium]